MSPCGPSSVAGRSRLVGCKRVSASIKWTSGTSFLCTQPVPAVGRDPRLFLEYELRVVAAKELPAEALPFDGCRSLSVVHEHVDADRRHSTTVK